PRLLRRRPAERDKTVVRYEREQFRRRRRVRRTRPGPRHHRRRAEQRARLAALRRPGRTLRDRRPAPRLLLPRGRGGRREEDVQAGGEVERRAPGGRRPPEAKRPKRRPKRRAQAVIRKQWRGRPAGRRPRATVRRVAGNK